MIGSFGTNRKWNRFLTGVLLTFGLSIVAIFVAKLPFFSIMGPLVIAILIGFAWRCTIGVPVYLKPGITFSSKNLLRLGIILLGMRLDLLDIYHAGISVFLLASVNVVFTLVVVYFIGNLLKINNKLTILIACGTAICGAAAVIAISSQIKAKERDTILAAGVVCLLGTFFTLLYSIFYSNLGLTSVQFGVFAGGSLHEVAHVIAASAIAGSDAIDMAVIVKLTRVVMLVPVAIFFGILANRHNKEEKKGRSLPIQWFIVGFLFMSTFNTLNLIPNSITTHIVSTSYILMGMAMAGLGLNLEPASLKGNGKGALVSSFIGSITLVITCYLVIRFMIVF